MKRIHVVCGGKGREKEANGIAMRHVVRPLIWWVHLKAFFTVPLLLTGRRFETWDACFVE